MASIYRYVLDCPVVEHLLGLPARQRDPLVPIFRHPAADPFQPGEQTFRNSTGREIQKKTSGQWVISGPITPSKKSGLSAFKESDDATAQAGGPDALLGIDNTKSIRGIRRGLQRYATCGNRLSEVVIVELKKSLTV